MNVNILHLYPKEMNLYGDHGNVLALKKRLEWRGYKVKIWEHEPGMELPRQIDIIFGGGGQDSGQGKIEKDLIRIAPKLKALIEDDIPALVICGMYQLFGKYFQTAEGQKIQGADILKLATVAGNNRLIGNVVIDSPEFGEIVGYENHSGLTILGEGVQALGVVRKGQGNNDSDKSEGCRYKNCIGTYLHGPILPKNPRIADYLIDKALDKHSCKVKLEPLNDRLENRAHKVAASRPR